ncbi:MAG: hypothetical protein HY328_17920 [Chloroflexi bacterium]|nr:hypothetical protein [Chloroflexota bacterium]
MKREIDPRPHVSHFTFHAAALLLYTLLTAVMTWPLALHLTSAIPGDSFDGWQNFWNLWWVKLALVDRQQTPFVTDLLYAPTGVGFYFHTLNPFNGLATLPVQLVGGLYAAYNAVVFLSWVLGGYGVFLLTLWVLRGRLEIRDWRSDAQSPISNLQSTLSNRQSPVAYAPAFVAGLIFTFAPFHMAHLLGHMQVMSLEWMPFYVLYLLRASQRQRSGQPWLRDSFLAGLFLVLVGLCDWYFVLYLFLFTALYLVLEIGDWRLTTGHVISNLQSLISNLLPAIIAGALFCFVLSPILLPMISEALRFSFMQRPASDLYILSAAAADFFVPNRLHTLFRPQSFTWPGNQIAPVSERTIAIGYTALLLAGLGALWAWRRSRFWLSVAAFFFLLALGPALHLTSITAADIPAGDPGPTSTLYGVLVEWVPFMRISRSVSRFAVMVQLALSVAAGVGLYELLARVARLNRRWLSRPQLGRIETDPIQTSGQTITTQHRPLFLTALAALLVLAEFWVAPFPISPPDTPDFYRQLAADSTPGALLNLPMNYDRPGYLLYQTVHRKPLTVAYISRDDPRTLTERSPVLQHFRHLGPDILDVDPAALGPTVLADLGVGWVVADRYKMPGGLEREYTSELAAAIFAGQPPLYEDERITAWRVTAPDASLPYLLLGPLGWGPLVEEGGIRGRWLGEEAAELHLRHTPGVDVTVTIRYRTQPGGSAAVILPGLAATATLPPAPDGGEIALDFAQLLAERQASTSIETLDAIALQASAPATVFVESIHLDLP